MEIYTKYYIIICTVLFTAAMTNYILFVCRTPSSTGKRGENQVSKILSHLPSNYVCINNVLLDINGRTSQIDHIAVSKYGIFVIETKSGKGTVTGNRRDAMWNKYVHKDTPIKNPLHQNYGHIKALNGVLHLPESKYISLVTYSDETLLRVDADNVFNFCDLNKQINKYKTERLTDDDVISISETISRHNTLSRKNMKKHIRQCEEYERRASGG